MYDSLAEFTYYFEGVASVLSKLAPDIVNCSKMS